MLHMMVSHNPQNVHKMFLTNFDDSHVTLKLTSLWVKLFLNLVWLFDFLTFDIILTIGHLLAI